MDIIGSVAKKTWTFPVGEKVAKQSQGIAVACQGMGINNFGKVDSTLVSREFDYSNAENGM